jgi:ACS family hexuronate transporter-like MFS transporter
VRTRWVVCLLLFAATTINYVDRQILALVKPILDDQLHWTNAEYGRVNAAFQGAYALGLLLFGFLVDRVGTKVGYALSIAGWSLAAMAHALVGGVGGFLRVRVALGLSEGGNFPSAIKTVALWFPRRERALATALFNAGANVGAVVAPAVVPWIALTWDWRAAFFAAGCVGLLWLALWLPFYDRPEQMRRLDPAELAHIRGGERPGDDGAPADWREILRHRQAWSFITGKVLTDPVWWFFLIWLPDFFKKTRGLDIKGSRLYLVSIYGIVTVLSVAGGWLAGALVRRGATPTRARKTVMLLSALAVLPIMAVTHVSTWTAVVLIGVAGAAHQAWSANLFTTVSDLFPKRAVATLVGIGGMAGSASGIVFPILVGELLDRFQAAGNATGGYAILFTVCGLAYVVAFGVGHLLAPTFEPVALGPPNQHESRRI